MRPREGSAGFTLVETLIALAIIAAALGGTLQVVAAQARTTRAVDDRRMAMLVAQSQLAAIAAAADSGQFTARGRTSGVAWRVDIAPYQTSYTYPRVELITVAAGAGSAGRPLVTLHSLRLARP